MAKLHLRVWCQAYYDTEMDVPDGLTTEEAFEYAKDHLEDAPLTNLEYLESSDNLDDEDFNFPSLVYLEA